MSLQDYAQRRYDYLALQGIKRKGDALLGLALFSENTSGKICVGVQKLAQRWLLEFLTIDASMPGLPARGCNFMRIALAGGFRTRQNVTSAFAAADLTIRRNLLAEEYDEMPLDERFADAELLAVEISPTAVVDRKSGTSAVYLNMSVKISSGAGDDYTVVFPVETLP
jgi:hypothetical protein